MRVSPLTTRDQSAHFTRCPWSLPPHLLRVGQGPLFPVPPDTHEWAKVPHPRSRPIRNVPVSALPTLTFALPLVASSAPRSRTTPGAWHHSASPPVASEPGLPPNTHQQLTSPALLCAAISARCGRGGLPSHLVQVSAPSSIPSQKSLSGKVEAQPVSRFLGNSALPRPRHLYFDACWSGCWRLACHHACLS